MSDTQLIGENLLKVEFIAGSLVMSIGWRRLKQAAENIPGHEIAITHDSKFFESILSALHEEQEDGSTLVHRMLDEAVVFAHEQGLEGFAEEYEIGPDEQRLR
jgi:hypothetical protein